GGALGFVVRSLRLFVAAGPAWLMLRGHEQEADHVVHDIEDRASKGHPDQLPPPEGDKLKILVRDHTPMKDIFRNMLVDNRQRSILGLVLMVAQAFFFNAIFFSYGLVVKKFF